MNFPERKFRCYGTGYRLDRGDGKFFCGIDRGGYSHQICVLNARGVEVEHRKITHTVDGLATLVALIASVSGPVRIALERAEGLLVEYLQQCCDAEIYCVSPKISAHARERYQMASANSDEFDAYVLADTLRHQYRQWRPLATPLAVLATAEKWFWPTFRDQILNTPAAEEYSFTEEVEPGSPLHLPFGLLIRLTCPSAAPEL